MPPPLPSDERLERRQFLQGLAAMATTAALSGCANREESSLPHGSAIDRAREASALNTLLALEYSLIDGYHQGITLLTAAHEDSSLPQPERDLAGLALAVAQAFLEDHEAHAALLSEMLTNLGATPLRPDEAPFIPPPQFKPSVGNALKLAANEERRATFGYNRVVQGLNTQRTRFGLASIEGVQAQHFMVLKALIDSLVDTTSTFDAQQAVPAPFVSSTVSLGGGSGLQDVPDLAVNNPG
ncbi:ferritin-like domain-containing protein [Myxococcus landrumensis]|uniref:Ferritin-like domain-containing protein n=1 Tax=Myxococcus landrumensis TaxID=2813577 RepID=A0ABX7MZR9_9BACT|nr:ferritin-like domain-containing protein [Myxococcus landrumus]QSQ11713.1 ferritin-like domain-containing protein [Myxococcus landrumus]